MSKEEPIYEYSFAKMKKDLEDHEKDLEDHENSKKQEKVTPLTYEQIRKRINLHLLEKAKKKDGKKFKSKRSPRKRSPRKRSPRKRSPIKRSKKIVKTF